MAIGYWGKEYYGGDPRSKQENSGKDIDHPAIPADGPAANSKVMIDHPSHPGAGSDTNAGHKTPSVSPATPIHDILDY